MYNVTEILQLMPFHIRTYSMMFERSSTISNSAAHDISHNVLVLTHSVWGTKMSLNLPSS